MAADALEEVSQVSEGVDTEPLRGGDETGQYGGGPTAVVAAQKHPIFPVMEVLS
jgi:hypothetical protein